MAVENLYVAEGYWAHGYAEGDGWVYPGSELQKAAPSAIIELFELELNVEQHGIAETFRFHAGSNLNANGELVWAGNNYLRFPVEADGFKYEGRGSLPRPTLRIANLTGAITALLLTLPRGLEGAKFTRIRTLARYLDAINFPGSVNPLGTPDPTAEFPREVFYVDRKATENRDVIEFELAAAFDLANVRAPKRQCLANICQWKYRSAECGYTGTLYFDALGNTVGTLAQDVCGKSLDSCKLRFGAVVIAGTVTAGSNLLALDTAAALVEAGNPVQGFGVPAGTTVASRVGSSITMSANATANTFVTQTGTLQTNRTQIIMTSVANLGVGMTVSGPKIPAGTTIAAIAGNTVTLGQPVAVADVVAAVLTRAGWTSGASIPILSTTDYILFDATTGISTGMYISGPYLALETGATVIRVPTAPNRYGSYAVRISHSVPRSTTGSSTFTFYSPQSQPPQTYTFAAPRNYTFRADPELPFGSYPGIGTYTV